MRRDTGVAIALAIVAGCYNPVVPSGVPCGAQGQCPSGQSCDLQSGLCYEGVPPDSGSEPDGPTPDTVICDPTESVANGECFIPITSEVAPTAVSAAACITGDANLMRSVAFDAGNRIYAVFRCGTTNDGFVVTSNDGGVTTSAPQPLGTGLTGVAVQGGPRKVAYVASVSSTGTAITVTQDGGATWSTTQLDTAAPDAAWGVAVAAAGDSVYVAARVGANNVRVWRNANRGTGTFASVDVAVTTVFGELVVDPQTGNVWVGGDSPALHVRRSQDGGATFATAIDPAASYNYSDWTVGGGSIIVTGSQPTFTLLATSDPTMVTPVNAMLPTVVSRGRAISAASDGSVFVANQDSTGALTFLRFDPGSATGTPRTAGPGTGPSVTPGPGRTAAVTFTQTASTKVWLGVYVY